MSSTLASKDLEGGSSSFILLWIGFQGDLLARPGHPQEPGDPLEEDDPHPGGHVVGVRLPVVVVEDHDGGDHAGGHHEHDAVEVSPWRGENGQRQVEVKLVSKTRWQCALE